MGRGSNLVSIGWGCGEDIIDRIYDKHTLHNIPDMNCCICKKENDKKYIKDIKNIKYNTKMSFTTGKHTGETYDEVFEKDFNYSYWFYNNMPKDHEFNKFLQANHKQELTPENQIVSFGKYKNKSFRDANLDVKYAKYILTLNPEYTAKDGSKKENFNLSSLQKYIRN